MRYKVYILGDSTVKIDESIVPSRVGWGQLIQSYFGNEVCFYNHGKAGRGTKNFIAEGRFETVLKEIVSGDYVLIQFGHNDSKEEDSSRYEKAFEGYKENLTFMIISIRQKKGIPILVTPVVLRNFNESGQLEDFHKDYLVAMKEVASEQKVNLIDLESKSRRLLEALGPCQSKSYYYHLKAGEHPEYNSGIKDDVHFNMSGAKVIAGLVVEGIEELELPIMKYCLKTIEGRNQQCVSPSLLMNEGERILLS